MPVYAFDGHNPKLPPEGDYFLAPTATVIGRVTLERDVSIWFGAVLRGDVEPIIIGAGSNIQDNCVLHTDPGYPLRLGRNVVVGHNVILHGCTIGDNVLIGMGAVIMNGVTVGEGAVIGAGALIPEGKEIPPRALVVGMPGKVRRILTEEESQGLTSGAATYQERFRRYLKTMHSV
ncbi:gamma carbonic anhydrase family protein [Thermopetrobacter sp. TC1]|uniref:gamma carbonic anhydrase family protein n=1 Tax=Thermopetrobacter sp. TC1 TaxID=1495045 RepID=UPI0005714F34|nr:gamma carbonic anhydrase family protein [Thermopetrobacter sp. TC1]